MSRPVIAILRGVTPPEAVEICGAILETGIDRIEVPLNSPDPFESIRLMAEAYGDRALIGAGTVLSVEDVGRVAQAGGKLVVSPNCDQRVIVATKAAGMQSWPGVLTPTECFEALKAGADGLKIFPATIPGPDGIKAIQAQIISARGLMPAPTVLGSVLQSTNPATVPLRSAQRQKQLSKPTTRPSHDL